MKKTLVTALLAIPMLGLSSMAFAAPAPSETGTAEPMLLSAQEMDGITAGSARQRGPVFDPPRADRHGGGNAALSNNILKSVLKLAQITQINISPVIIIQIGNGNTAIVYSGNFLNFRQ
ncbi:hypothetical protein [Noviherbaspirillum massiliense]|uniref:hypothetical protein n=1 Tax=Noviherbaspirillum massiliense TaxID=1465823 RepID=UPI0002E8CDE2|nr:hypothetical protein [Noviherbaspirillum massiliense]